MQSIPKRLSCIYPMYTYFYGKAADTTIEYRKFLCFSDM